VATPYRSFWKKVLNKEVDLDSDTLKATLHTATYTPNLDTHDYFDDVTNELGTAGGYTAGGVTVTSVTLTQTAANSWGTVAATSTAYSLGKVVRPSTGNGFVYRAAVAGTSGASAPTWPTVVGQTVTDGTVTWECVGSAVLAIDFDDPTWPATFTAGPFRYMVIHDRTPATDATRPLVCLTDFGSNQTGGGGAFSATVDSQGAFHMYLP
jgi:hypothetical protein